MRKKWHVFFITGITWAGKNTLIKKLIEAKIWLEFVLSCKTRDLREWEKNGVDYYKFSKQKFKEMIASWEFLEYNFVHNQDYYGTRKADIFENGIEKGKNIIKEIDMLILPTLIETVKNRREDFSIIVLDIPISEVKTRMIARGDEVDGEDYKNRLNSAKKEKKFTYLADFLIDGSQSREAVFEEVKNIITTKIS